MRRKHGFTFVELLVVITLISFLSSCALLQSIGIATKPYSDMTPKEKVTFLFKMYNKQYDDYKVMTSDPKLTEAQKVVMREKKKVLTQVYPIIQALDLNLVEGKPLDKVFEPKAIELLNMLGAKITK